MSVAFGRALAEKSRDPLSWLDRLVAAYVAAPPDKADFGLLGGFMGGFAHRDLAATMEFKQRASRSTRLAPTLPFVCACIGVVPSDVPLVIEARSRKLLPASQLRFWAGGGALTSLPADIVSPLFDDLLQSEAEAYSVGLELIVMYAYGRRGSLEYLRPQLRLVADNASMLSKHNQYHMDQPHFSELMEWILAKGRDDADARSIALALAKGIAAANRDFNDEPAKPLLPRLLRDFPEIVWPIIGHAIIADRRKRWRFEYLMRGSGSPSDDRCNLLQLPEEVLFAWCHAHPEKAPAFAARVVPLLKESDAQETTSKLHPVMKRIIDEFGDRDNVLDALTSNIHTFSWSGSLTTYYALYDEPLRDLESHRLGTVRRWAKTTLSQLRRAGEEARFEDEEG
jgi:hypothetical protein